MDSKGQASAEYLLLIVILLIIMGAVTIPLVGTSIDASMDVSDASQIKTAVSGIASAADLVYANGPGAKRTINVYIPQNNVPVTAGATGISMVVTLSGGTTKRISGDTAKALSSPTTVINQGWHQVQVDWNRNSPAYITVTFVT
jgi:uncharacterized protein (UPF0333 family)